MGILQQERGAALQENPVRIEWCYAKRHNWAHGGKVPCSTSMNTAIILAAGKGDRMGENIPKQFLMIHEQPLFLYSFKTFAAREDIGRIVIVLPNGWQAFVSAHVSECAPARDVHYVIGGQTRQHSILSGLNALAPTAKEDDIVVIHDAARPLVSDDVVTRCIEACTTHDGAVTATPATDTMYTSTDRILVSEAPKREELFVGQAPESFRFWKYIRIHQHASDKEISETTGSTEIAIKHGLSIKIVPGSTRNLKVTTIGDLELLKMLIGRGTV